MPNHEFKILPSRQYGLLISLIIIASFILVIGLPLQLVIKFSLCLFLLVYGYTLLKHRNTLTALHYIGKGRWLISSNNQVRSASLRGDTTVTARVSVLRFRIDNQIWPKSYVIFRDALAPDQYRKLIVIMRMG